jgi:hypothetical protein
MALGLSRCGARAPQVEGLPHMSSLGAGRLALPVGEHIREHLRIRVLQIEVRCRNRLAISLQPPSDMMHSPGARMSTRQSQALVAIFLIVILGLCLLHFGVDGSDMGGQDPCLSLGAGLILVFALVAFWHSSWMILEPVSTRYATSLYLSSPPPKRSLLP